MFNLTQQERTVLLFLAVVILVGSLLEIVSKKSANVRHFLEFADKNYSSTKIKTFAVNKVRP